MANDVNRLIDMLYERIEDAKSPALKPNMSMVDRDELLDLLDELRAQLPVEIKRAQELLSARDKFVEDAKRDVDRMMRQAELAAELLDLDPTCIYTAERFNEELIRRFSEEDSHQPGEMEQALRRVNENPSTASEIFGRFKSMTERERLHIVTHLVYGALSGSVPMPAAQLAGAAFPREMSAAIYLWLLGCSTDTGEEPLLRPAQA